MEQTQEATGKSCKEMILLLASLLAFPNFLCVRADAQVPGGPISGTLTDASQVAIPNAQVTLSNLATGVVSVVKSDATGFYTFPDLVPGTYEMTIEASGFVTQVRTNIAMTVGAKLLVNVVTLAGDSKQVGRGALSG